MQIGETVILTRRVFYAEGYTTHAVDIAAGTHAVIQDIIDDAAFILTVKLGKDVVTTIVSKDSIRRVLAVVGTQPTPTA
jgi:hypothetical protein